MPQTANASDLPNEAPQDFYGHRLAEVNKTNPVIANENILNSQGVLLVAKGSEISETRAEMIAKHKLIKPLEHSVDVSESLDARGLVEVMQNYMQNVPGMQAILDEEAWKKISILSQHYEKYSLIRQKLTVLSNQLPDIYYDSLYSAVAGVLIGMQMALPDEELRVIFIGALMHNTGYLHLNPELVYDERQGEDNISKDVQAHPIIAKHFLDHIPGMSKKIGTAVAEHHERTDGTGYPKARFGNDLSLTGQIIAMTDTIVKSYKRCLKYGEHAHQLILLILQLNDNVHFEEVYKASAQLIRQGPMPTHPPANPPDAKVVLQRVQQLVAAFDAAKKLAFVLMKSTRNRFSRSIASMIGRLATSIVSSGLMQEEFNNWIEGLIREDKPEDYLTLLKCDIMLSEIGSQMRKLQFITWKCIEAIPDSESRLKEDCIHSFKHVEKLQS